MRPRASAYRIAGHQHPTVHLGRGADSLWLACFHANARGLVLPAFGEFTGGWRVQPKPGERVYA